MFRTLLSNVIQTSNVMESDFMQRKKLSLLRLSFPKVNGQSNDFLFPDLSIDSKAVN